MYKKDLCTATVTAKQWAEETAEKWVEVLTKNNSEHQEDWPVKKSYDLRIGNDIWTGISDKFLTSSELECLWKCPSPYSLEHWFNSNLLQIITAVLSHHSRLASWHVLQQSSSHTLVVQRLYFTIVWHCFLLYLSLLQTVSDTKSVKSDTQSLILSGHLYIMLVFLRN